MVDRVVESEKAVTQSSDGVTSTQRVATSAEASGSVLAARIITYITNLLLALLALRFILSLLGANAANAFADLIYNVTYPFVAPFFGLFGYKTDYGVSRFEVDTLVAMLVYALVGYGLSRLFTIKQIDG